jgi:hypothetical protein
MTEGKLNCRGNTDSTFPLDAGFLCSGAAMAAAMLRDMIKWTFYTIICISNKI